MAAPTRDWLDHDGAHVLLDPAALTRLLEPSWRSDTAWPEDSPAVGYVRFGADQAWAAYREDDARAAQTPVGYASCLRGFSAPTATPRAAVVEVGSRSVSVHRWPDDAGLPALRRALTDDELARVFATELPVALEVIHYKPERRAVLRARSGGRTAYVRIRADGAAADREVPLLEHLHRWLDADPEVRLPQVLASPWGSGGVIISAVGGVSLTSLFGGPAERSACRSVGRVLARHHAVPPPDLGSPLPCADRAPMVRTTLEDLDQLAQVAPPLAQPVDELRRRLLASAGAARGTGVLLHGGMHPGNALVDGGVVGIIDLDGAAIGEREADLGKLLAGIVIHDRGNEWSLAGEVLAAYETEAGQRVGREVLGVWMAGVLVTRAMRALRRGEQLRTRRAERLLAAAVRGLDAGLWP